MFTSISDVYLKFKVMVYISFLFMCIAKTVTVNATDFNVGVYYYPGWSDNLVGGAYPLPWEQIKPYPEREPLLGWYQDTDPGVIRQQLAWMHTYGIDYVVFDWLWGRDSKGYLEHVIKNYLGLAVEDRSNVRFAVLWANHTDYIFSLDQLTKLINYWCDNFFNQSTYQTINNKPAIFIFSARILNNNLAQLGMTSAEFISYAESIAKAKNLPGISFIAGSWANDSVLDYSSSSGYTAFTSYNLQSPATYRLNNTAGNMSHSFYELDLSYQDHWRWMRDYSGPDYIVPVTTGWDKRPWGGSSDPLHDNSSSTPDEFRNHLISAREFMLQNQNKTKNNIVVCCWNEYGEGSIVEPKKTDGFTYLEIINEVFNQP